jgi:hypothetical protein
LIRLFLASYNGKGFIEVVGTTKYITQQEPAGKGAPNGHRNEHVRKDH